MKIMQIVCNQEEPIDPESFCIWIAIPDDMTIEPIAPEIQLNGKPESKTFEVMKTDYKELVPGTDFILKYNQAE